MATDGSEQNSEDSLLGHEGVGDDCLDKVVNYTPKFFLAGGAFGAAEGCFLTPIPGDTSPMIFRTFGVMFRRSILFASVGAVYVGGVCTAAKIRDKDDYVNASIGGALAGSIFGIKNRKFSLGLGVAVALAVAMGLVKFRTDSYFPNPWLLPRTPPQAIPLPPLDQEDSENNNKS